MGGQASTSHIVRDPDLKIQTANGDKISVGEEEGGGTCVNTNYNLECFYTKQTKAINFSCQLKSRYLLDFEFLDSLFVTKSLQQRNLLTAANRKYQILLNRMFILR